MKRTLHIVLPVLILAVAGTLGGIFASWPREAKQRPPAAPPPLIRSVRVEPTDHQLTVRSQGTVRPLTSSRLVAQVSGVVVEVSPAWGEGAFFEKGDTLLKIEPADYELAVTVAKSEVAQAEVQVARETEEARIAREEWARLHSGGESPPPLVAREPQLAQARALLEAAHARKAQAELDLARTEIRAPFAGRVLEILVDRGESVTRGAPVARIYSTDFAEVRLPIPDELLARLDVPMSYRGEPAAEKGPAVILRARFAGREHAWQGRIVRTEGQIDPRSHMVHLVARVADPYGRVAEDPERPPLAAGLFVRAEIEGRELHDVFLLPRHVLRDEKRLLVIDAESRLRFREVEAMNVSGDRIAVRSGLEEGEVVCLSPLELVVDGMPVRTEAEP